MKTTLFTGTFDKSNIKPGQINNGMLPLNSLKRIENYVKKLPEEDTVSLNVCKYEDNDWLGIEYKRKNDITRDLNAQQLLFELPARFTFLKVRAWLKDHEEEFKKLCETDKFLSNK